MAGSNRGHGLSARAARWLEPGLLVLTAAGLLAGGMAWGFGAHDLADVFWAAGTALAIAPSVGWVAAALRRGRAGVDVIATLALVGTLAVGEYLAGSLIALMLATGRTLDAFAERRASPKVISHPHRPRCVPGHEVVGRVVAVGPDAAAYALGERVGIAGRRASGGTARRTLVSETQPPLRYREYAVRRARAVRPRRRSGERRRRPPARHGPLSTVRTNGPTDRRPYLPLWNGVDEKP